MRELCANTHGIQYRPGLLYYPMTLQFYIAFDVDPEVPERNSTFRFDEGMVTHGYRSKPAPS